MAHALVALGSNLGGRAETLDAALTELSRVPATRLICRSGWYETPPIGGPAGQGAFLNGAALLSTTLTPPMLLASLQRIELELGRVRSERWGARMIDLDLLLFDRQVIAEVDFALPHPRMAYRQFVLEPAAKAAPWMVDPTCGWTVQALWSHLRAGANVVAIAAESPSLAAGWRSRLSSAVQQAAPTALRESWPSVTTWDEYRRSAGVGRPRLILAFTGDPSPPDMAPTGATGNTANPWRTILHLPQDGPIAWIPEDGRADPLAEAVAAIQAVWPALASTAPLSN